jgi:hypothetical protein
MHAAIHFCFEHYEIARSWFEISNYLCMLSIAGETEMVMFIERAQEKGIKLSIFREPDLDNRITAISLECGVASKKLCSNLPLAFKEK